MTRAPTAERLTEDVPLRARVNLAIDGTPRRATPSPLPASGRSTPSMSAGASDRPCARAADRSEHRGPCARDGPLPALAALVRDRLTLARLVESVRRSARVVACSRVDDVRTAVRDGAAVVVLDDHDVDGIPTDGLIRTLRSDAPALPILAYCAPGTAASREIVAAVHAGATGLLFRGADDVGLTVQAAIAAASERGTALAVLRMLGPLVPPCVRAIVEHCVTRTAEPLTVSQLAAALGVHRKTVTCRLHAAGYPDPRTLIGWCRLLHASAALGTSQRSAERIANDLEFPSVTAMRNLLRRYTGLRPSDVRACGGVACVLARFRLVLEAGGTTPAHPTERVSAR